MKKYLILLLGFLLSSCFLQHTVRAENIVKLASLEWEPYIGTKLKDQGYAAILTREAFKASGYSVEISFMPWARVVAMAREGKYDGYLPEYSAESLKNDFLVSDPFPGGPLVLFKRKSDSITYTSLADLKPYKIGVVRDYVNTEEFDKALFLQKELANNDTTNLRKLMGKRIDLVVMDKFVGIYLMKQDFPDHVEEIDILSQVLEEKSLHLCISKKSPDAETKMKAFNDGLKIIKDNGMVEALLKTNGFI